MQAILLLILAAAPWMSTNSPALMERASALGLPVELMSATNQELVCAVTEHCTLQRNVPPKRFVGSAENFSFMLDHMEVCSVLAEEAGLTTYRPVAMPDGRLYADNQQEAAGFLVLVYCGENQRIYYVEGSQKGVFTARGRGVVVVDYKQVTPLEVEYRGQLFVRIDNSVAATLARLFFVFLRGAVDSNFAHIMRQPICLAQLITDNPHILRAVIDQSPPEDYELLAPLKPLLLRETQ